MFLVLGILDIIFAIICLFLRQWIISISFIINAIIWFKLVKIEDEVNTSFDFIYKLQKDNKSAYVDIEKTNNSLKKEVDNLKSELKELQEQIKIFKE